MIALFLQLMGFKESKPVHSRASQDAELVHAQANTARRTDVKAIAGAPKVAAKVIAKAPAKLQSKSPAAKAAPKKAVKVATAPKSVQKPSGKMMAKTIGKVATKAAAKAGTKAVTKTDHKAKLPKVTSKASPSALKNSASKAAAKVVAKPATKPVTKGVAKVAPNAASKTTHPKSAEKAVAKKVTENVTGKVIEVLKRKSEPKISSVASAKAVTASKPIATPVIAAQPTAVAVLAPKPGRPSSRLAQLTVVGMAQSVASTAAKSSYSQTVSLPVIVPSMAMAAKKDPKLANNWKTKPVEQLTDPELLSMPDAEYMNDKQMAVFRLKLSVLKQDILNSASDTTEHLREDTVVVPDPADRATIEEEHALELRTRDRERKLLKKIEQSINRIDAGDYGYCDETGEPIGVGRLLARPTATLSLEAQQRRELKQKMFGD